MLFSPLTGAGRFFLARQTLRDLTFSASTNPNTSATVPSESPYNSSQATSSTSTSGHQTPTLNTVRPPLPYPLNMEYPFELQNWPDINSGYCAVEDAYCSYEGFNKTTGKASVSAFANQCLLWDTSCVGNKTLAIEEFFNTTEWGLLGNECFVSFDSSLAGIGVLMVFVPENAATGAG